MLFSSHETLVPKGVNPDTRSVTGDKVRAAIIERSIAMGGVLLIPGRKALADTLGVSNATFHRVCNETGSTETMLGRALGQPVISHNGYVTRAPYTGAYEHALKIREEYGGDYADQLGHYLLQVVEMVSAVTATTPNNYHVIAPRQ